MTDLISTQQLAEQNHLGPLMGNTHAPALANILSPVSAYTCSSSPPLHILVRYCGYRAGSAWPCWRQAPSLLATLPSAPAPGVSMSTAKD